MNYLLKVVGTYAAMWGVILTFCTLYDVQSDLTRVIKSYPLLPLLGLMAYWPVYFMLVTKPTNDHSSKIQAVRKKTKVKGRKKRSGGRSKKGTTHGR